MVELVLVISVVMFWLLCGYSVMLMLGVVLILQFSRLGYGVCRVLISLLVILVIIFLLWILDISIINLLLFSCVIRLYLCMVVCRWCVIFCSRVLFMVWLSVLLMSLNLLRLRKNNVYRLWLCCVCESLVVVSLQNSMWLGMLVR